MKTVKRAVGVVLFLLILALLVSALTQILRDKNEANIVYPFYDEPKDSLDVVFVGSSFTMCGMYPMELYDQFGIASYNYASSALVFPQAYYQTVEALKYQSPKVLVIDASGAVYADDKVGSKEYVHVQLDNMKWSMNKLRAIQDLIEDPSDRLEYYFPLLKFHTRWKNVTEEDYKPITGPSKGAFVSDAILADPTVYPTVPAEEKAALSRTAETYLRRILDTCREEGVTVLLVNYPTLSNEDDQRKYNAVADIAGEYGVEYLNLLHGFEELGLDPYTDFRDQYHLNRSGALKVTAALGAYLKERYDLPDRREDPDYAPRWNDALSLYRETYPD